MVQTLHHQLPIWRDAMRLVVEEAHGFPRYHKYTLGSDLRAQARQVCRPDPARLRGAGTLRRVDERSEIHQGWQPRSNRAGWMSEAKSTKA